MSRGLSKEDAIHLLLLAFLIGNLKITEAKKETYEKDIQEYLK